jgi:hypothetical protein
MKIELRYDRLFPDREKEKMIRGNCIPSDRFAEKSGIKSINNLYLLTSEKLGDLQAIKMWTAKSLSEWRDSEAHYFKEQIKMIEYIKITKVQIFRGLMNASQIK